MSEYNIQIGVDSRKAKAGVKAFGNELKDALAALRKFDQQSRSAFAQLDRLAKTNLGSLAKAARGTAQALEALNKVKISKALVGNLDSLQRSLRNFRFNAAAVKAIPDALNALNRVKLDSRLPTVITQMKVALTGFRGPPKGAVDNLVRLAQGLAVVNPASIERAASALQRLNGFKFSAPRGGIGGLGNISRQIAPIRNLQSQIGGLSNSLGHLRTALAGVSATIVARGVWQTGTSFQSLQRAIAATATSTSEVSDQMQFLEGLTKRLPVSLDALVQSYGQFSVAAKLGGASLADIQKVYEGFSTAFSATGASIEAQKRGILALTQIFSKSRVQSEELRLQLAEALPGAVSILAESMGVTTAQLQKMLEAGEVSSSALIGMADVLQSRFGPAVAIA